MVGRNGSTVAAREVYQRRGCDWVSAPFGCLENGFPGIGGDVIPMPPLPDALVIRARIGRQ